MADEITTTGESQASSTEATSATSETATATSAAPEAQAPPQTATSTPDYGALTERLGQYETYFKNLQQQQEAQAKQYQQLQQVMLQTFAPDHYQRMNQPRYLTEEQAQQQFERYRQEAQASAMAMAVRTELASAKEKFADVFEAYEEDDILRRWQKTGESIASICKKLEERTAKEFEKRQAKFMAAKQQVAETTKGSPKSGGAPAPSTKTGRGFSGLRQVIRDRLGSS